MEKDTYRVGINEGLRITAVLEPSDASNTNMTWSVADSSIASIRRHEQPPRGHRQALGRPPPSPASPRTAASTTTAAIKTGNYNKAVKITDLYGFGQQNQDCREERKQHEQLPSSSLTSPAMTCPAIPCPAAPTVPTPSAAPMATPFMRATAPSMASSTLRTLSSPKRPSAAWS